MGMNYSQINNDNNKDDNNKNEIDTLCISLDVYEKGIKELFYKLISKIEQIFNINLNETTGHNRIINNELSANYKTNNILLELKLVKLGGMGYTQIKIKMLVHEDDKVNKDKFDELCTIGIKSIFFKD
jgi:hypothetical protein